MGLKQEFETLIEGMSIEDMPNDDMKLIAGECGIKVAVALLKKVNGINFYVPKLDAFCKIVKDFVITHFTRTNAKELAVICRISQRKVYEIVESEDARRKAKNKKVLK